MKTPIQIVQIPLQAAGVCTAAGGLAATRAGLSSDAPALGPELLDAFDGVGDPVCAMAAAPNAGGEIDLEFRARIATMLMHAMQDLTLNSTPDAGDLAAHRLFIIEAESAADSGTAWLMQAWMTLHGAVEPGDQRAMQQRISSYTSAAEALHAASSSLAVGGQTALVLCCESWLTRDAIARLDDEDLLCCPSSDGVLPGEAAVLLRLESGAALLRCAGLVEAEDRHANERPIGSLISESILALQGEAKAATVIADAHASQRALSRESEFLRRRHWADLPLGGPAWLGVSALGYLGRCAPLLQLALLAQLPAQSLPALAYARSLWKQGLVASRA